MARSRSSHRWLKEHHDDLFVQRARSEGYRSRAIYKLQEIQEKDRLIKKGMFVVELGAAPGGWSQYVAQILDGTGKMIALDILPMDSLADVIVIQGDFTEESVLQELRQQVGGAKVDLVLSDMAPNTSGIRTTDQAKSMYLCELALDFACESLKEGGDFLTKIFHGPGFDAFYKHLKKTFQTVSTRKPQASRARSQETYVLARGFKGRRD